MGADETRGWFIERAPPLPLLFRSEILAHLDLVTVCFGLLINLTSLHPDNRDRLRDLKGDLEGELKGSTIASGMNGAAGFAGAAKRGKQKDGGSFGVVGLLCSIFDVISEEVKSAEPSGADAAASSLTSVSGDEGDVTADELHEGHQDGEAAIVQVGLVICIEVLVQQGFIQMYVPHALHVYPPLSKNLHDLV